MKSKTKNPPPKVKRDRALSKGDGSRYGGALTGKSVVILYRPSRRLGTSKLDASKQAQELAAWLHEKKDVTVYSSPGQSVGTRFSEVSAKDYSTIDLVVVLGGDGTYLGAVRLLKGKTVPVLGVNMGSLGFLTETRVEDLFETVMSALSGKMVACHRSMLSITIRRGRKIRYQNLALNDCVIERGSITHLINMEIYSEKNLVAQVKADALVVATPTGSTAYNLAAGGPILHPEARAIVVTPVCPHALTTRPLIFPDDQKLLFRMLESEKKAVLTIDGAPAGELSMDDEIEIVRNPVDHIMLRQPSQNFFRLLREKLKFGERN